CPADHEMTCCHNNPDPHCHCNHWGYVGMCGERGWFGLCPEFCAGEMQSPINIGATTTMATLPWTFTGYDTDLATLTCENNGHFAICHTNTAATVSGGGLIGTTYKFEMMQFHIGCADGEGSEHTIDDM
ncbi:unnamed protein product, partial [Meganyctiphanes norvegica]